MTLSSDTQQEVVAPKPFVKWVGGKRQLLSELECRVPEKIDVYYEPFLGGGALFFHLADRITQAHLSDNNEELIMAYQAIRTNPNLLIGELSKHKNTEEHFQQIRDADRDVAYKWNWSPIQKAARFIYLNKTCFNGLYRVNSKGEFNVSYGKYPSPKIVDHENIYACHSVLSRAGVFIDSKSYESVYANIQGAVNLGRNVFVYLDPPYIPLSVTSSFTQYSKDGFTMKDQRELKTFCDALTKMGVKWMQSNSSAPIVFDMYKEYTVEVVSANRSVSATSTSRKVVSETIIRNYE
jgi:DNA adenine methylase